MGLVKTRRLAAMQKQQRAKAGMNPAVKKGAWALPPHLHKFGGKPAMDLQRFCVYAVRRGYDIMSAETSMLWDV